MISIKRALKSKRLMSALTGVTPDEFSKLLPSFAKMWNQTKEDKYLKDIKHRQRKPGGGTKGFVKYFHEIAYPVPRAQGIRRFHGAPRHRKYRF